MGRWSARLAPPFLDFAHDRGARRLLDLGCGTGTLSAALRRRAADAEIVGIDPVEEFVAFARQRVADPRARFQVGDAQALPFADGAFDATLSLLIFQELPAPDQALAEMRRVTRAGGTVATCQWDFVAGMPMTSCFWDAVVAVHPGAAAERRSDKRMPSGCVSEAQFVDLWGGCGLGDVAATTLEVVQDFDSFEDYWTPFQSGATSTSSYSATLPPETRDALKHKLKQMVLGEKPDGRFTMTARAFAVRGRVPQG